MADRHRFQPVQKRAAQPVAAAGGHRLPTEPPAAEDPAPDETLQAVLALPDDYKLPVYLYYYEGYPTAEIAQMLGTANATIRSRLNRARHKLKLTLGGA